MQTIIRELSPADLPNVPADARGWVAAHGDEITGFMLDVPDRRGDLRRGEWFASTPQVVGELYAVAAEAWMSDGITTHRILVNNPDPVADVLTNLGFGRQQAYASQPIDALLGDPQSKVTVRPVSHDEIATLIAIAPLVSNHQGLSPVFAPRTAEFFEQLPESVEEYVDDPACGAWLAWLDGTAVGFALAELSDGDLELTLVGVTPASRRTGAAAALIDSAVRWGEAQGASTVSVDWRTTNILANALWTRLGFVPSEFRWARTIDSTPS